MHLEAALDSIGCLGRGQLALVTLVCLLRTNISINLFSFTVVGRDFDRTIVRADGSVSNDTDACPEDEGDVVAYETDGVGLVSEWNLVCEE